MAISPLSIIDFWFSDRVKSQWFASTPALDQEIKDRYKVLWETAAQQGLDDWCLTPLGSLALVIVLDQFPLNMFRHQPLSFSTEQQAVAVARQAVNNQQDQQIEQDKLAFLYMPFMHSEQLDDQDQAVALYRAAGLTHNLRFAEHHRAIIQQYGRFPHRNAILSRDSSEQELAYLASDNAFTG